MNGTQLVEQRWSDKQIALVRSIAAPKCTDDEFALLLYQAQLYQLDPLLKQIWAVKYEADKPASIFAGHAGFVAIAHQSGQFDGISSVCLYDKDGKLSGARSEVWRKDAVHPFVVQVAFKEYNRNSRIWNQMPETMIKKVAESQALRRAFNIAGLYAPEEMPEPQSVPAAASPAEPKKKTKGFKRAPIDTLPKTPAATDATGTGQQEKAQDDLAGGTRLSDHLK